MQLESDRSTSSPLQFGVPIFSSLVSTRHLTKSADSIRARARSGMALRGQHPRKGPCRRVQSGRRTSCTSHGRQQGRFKHQDSCPSQRALAMGRFRFARDTIANIFTTSDVVNSRAELHAHIQRNIVYLRDLTEPNLLIIPFPSRHAARRLSDAPLYRPGPGLWPYRISRRTVNVGGTVELLCVIDLRAAICNGQAENRTPI
jgi:hypothetical protein